MPFSSDVTGKLGHLVGDEMIKAIGYLSPPTMVPADRAIPAGTSETYIVTKGGAAALTLGAPSLADSGTRIVITSDTANAHTLTATGLLDTGSASVDSGLFAAFKGAGLTLMAYNGRWKVLSAIGITFS